MNVLQLPSLEGIRPRRFGLVSWSAHVAFAFDLIADFRPRMVVELGTHSGESYFAFCQSVQENHVAATCYAVDTWQGDPQCGFYPADVYAEVFRHNQEFYADFSYLIQATFDEAVDRFVDGSVDLIHFDGLHTYEAVKHDLERWQPKLSPRGVAIFHDIAARHGDFGAWKLWEEIRLAGQSFAFRHGWGLGVWKPPGGQPAGSRLLETLFQASETEAENIRRYYILATEALRLGKAAAENTRLDEALKAITVRTEGLQEERARAEQSLHEIATRCDEALRAQAVLRAEAATRDDLIRTLQAELASRQAAVAEPPALRIYFSRNGIFDEENSLAFPLTPGNWQRITLPLPADWRKGSLRLDSGTGFGLFDLAGIRLRTTLLGEEVWSLLGAELKKAAVVAGSARLVPGARTLRVLCAESDPQILFSDLDLSDYDEPLTLEIGARLRIDLPGLMPTFQDLADAMLEWPAIQARLQEVTARLTESQEAHHHSEAELARARQEWSAAFDRQRASLEEQQAKHAEQRAADLQVLQDALLDSKNKLLDLETELHELRAQGEGAKLEGTAFRQEIAGLQGELHAINVRLADKDALLVEAYRRVDAKDAQLVAALAEGKTDHNRLRSMRRSVSWKLTLPLRIVGRFLTGKSTATQPAPLLPAGDTPSPAPAPADGGYRFELDEPASWNLPAQQVAVRGWCLPPQDGGEAVPLLRFRRGSLQTDVACQISRDDVQTAHGGGPLCRLCGFEATLQMPPGPSEVTVEAVDVEGRAWPLARFSARAPYATLPLHAANGDPAQDYAAWVACYDSFSSEDRRRLRQQARLLPSCPVISVVMPVYNAPEEWLVKAIESVRRQFYPFWEFCIADDNSTQPHVKEVLRRYERLDSRIKVVYRSQNGHISAASNSALEIATGEFVALLDHDDEIAPHALYLVAETLNAQPGLKMIYTDEDKIDLDGHRRDPYFKPDWNYDLFLGQNMFSHLGVFRRDLLTTIGGFQLGLEGSQDYDLALRCLEHVEPQEIGHIPRVLYHWRRIPGSTAIAGDEKPYAREAARRAIGQHLDRLGQGASVEQNPWLADFHRVRRALPSPPPEVAIIIPTRDGGEVLRTCIESVLQHTDYPNYRFVVIDNGSKEPDTFAYFQQLQRRLPNRFQVLNYPGEFNFSAINNFAVRRAGAPLLCFLNNDIEMTDAGWLTELASQATRPEVGAAGARLLYPDSTLQHAGIIIGLGADRTAGHAHHRLPNQSFGYFGRAKLIQQFSAVTAACMVLRRETFEEVGGFNEVDFPVGLNDVDLCLRLRERGYLIIWTPFAEMRHHESYSRGLPAPGSPAAARAQREIGCFRQRHGRFVQHDPAYNPNLTLDHSDFSLSAPPRLARPGEAPAVFPVGQ